MRLHTLGGLRLEGSDFKEPQPLLLLAYLALAGKRSRGEIKDLFWSHIPSGKHSKSLSEALRRLKMVSPNLVEPRREFLASYVGTDVHRFQRAVDNQHYEEAVGLYGGMFLHGLERKRVRLGEELEEWVSEYRSALQTSFLQSLLVLAEENLTRGNLDTSRDYVVQAINLPHDLAWPSMRTLTRLYHLLLPLGLEHKADKLSELALETHNSPIIQVLPNSWQSLQTSPASLIGRDAELNELSKLYLANARLVTVTGLAGIGKTELAKAFMPQASSLFEEQCFVSLTSLPQDATPELLWRTLAEALEMALPVERLLETLKSSSLLLVFDNFEPFLRLKTVVMQLLRDCPKLGILVTSRERLGLEPEKVLTLKGLSVPNEANSLITLSRVTSGKLLLSEASKRGVQFHDKDVPLLAELCRYLAGVPLAIKLAAGWLTVLPLANLLEHLQNNLDLLESPSISIKGAFDLSHALLAEDVAKVFTQLGIFKNGFSLEAAEAILAANLQQLKSLIDASLLDFDGDRYSLHPLIAQYLLEQNKPTDTLADKHARYFLSELGNIVHTDQALKDKATKNLRNDLPNLVLAWNHATQQGWTEQLAKRVSALQRLCDLLALPNQGLELLENTLQHRAQSDFLLFLKASHSWFLLRLGRYKEAINEAQAILASLPDGSDEQETCLNTLGAAHDSLGQFTEAENIFKKVLCFVKEDSGEAATAMANLAINAIKRGDYALAQSRLASAEAIFSKQVKQTKVVWCLYIGGWLALDMGDLLRARIKLEQAFARAQELNLTHWALLSQLKLSSLYAYEEHVERAKQECQTALDEINAKKLIAKESRALTTLAEISLLASEPRAALHYYAESLQKSHWTQSEPLILQHLIGILHALSELPTLDFQKCLYSFCADKSDHMFYKDRQSFISLSPLPDNTAWLELNASEAAILTLSLLKEAGMLKHPHPSA